MTATLPLPRPADQARPSAHAHALHASGAASSSSSMTGSHGLPVAGSDNVPPAKRARKSGVDGGETREARMAAIPVAPALRPQQPAAPVPEKARLWTDLARPQSAAEVLGNEVNAAYLRDWLRTLQIVAKQRNSDNVSKTGTSSASSSGTSLRNIGKQSVTQRTAAASRDELSEFLIGRNAEEEAWFDQFRQRDASINGGLPLGASLAGPGGTSLADAVPVDEAGRPATALSNVVVLVGPRGSGKTAAVYACAAELGFEVFELYPGMGRRSGKDIQSAVGDLGRNHMVSSGGTGGGAFRQSSATKAVKPVSAFFKPAAAATGSTDGHADAPVSSNGQSLSPRAPPTKSNAQIPKAAAPQPRQSLILLEEADILYTDDKGFWPAVIDLVGDSRRPIVLTCQGEHRGCTAIVSAFQSALTLG